MQKGGTGILQYGDHHQWQGQNLILSDLPDLMQNSIRKTHVDVPLEMAKILLPDSQMSVLDFVEVVLPPVCEDTDQASYHVPDGYSFFSDCPASDNVTGVLAILTVPPKGIVANLLGQVAQKWLDGANSITVPGTAAFLPLWVAKFWSDIQLRVHPTQQGWKQGIVWLQRPEFTAAFNNVVDDTLKSLGTLSWDGFITAGPFDVAKFPKFILTTYLSRRWLSDDHIDQILCSLGKEVNEKLPKQSIHFFDTIHARKLLLAYDSDRKRAPIYDPTNTKPFLSRFGATLLDTSVLAGIFHVKGNHWVTIVIDIAEKKVLYGDPAGLSRDEHLVATLLWYLRQHIPGLSSLDFQHEDLPSPDQDFAYDSHNCGIFSYNALYHYIFPLTPLLQHTRNLAYGDAARASFLQNIVKQYNSHVCLFDFLAIILLKYSVGTGQRTCQTFEGRGFKQSVPTDN